MQRAAGPIAFAVVRGARIACGCLGACQSRSVTPADRAVLAQAPERVVVRFDDDVRVAPGNAAVRNGDGSILDGKPSAHGKTLVLPLRANLGRGDYSVRWSAVSDDGHVVQGVIAFGVGTRPAAAGADASPDGRGRLRHGALPLGLLRRTARRVRSRAVRPARLAAAREERPANRLDRDRARRGVRLVARARARESRRRVDALRPDDLHRRPRSRRPAPRRRRSRLPTGRPRRSRSSSRSPSCRCRPSRGTRSIRAARGSRCPSTCCT